MSNKTLGRVKKPSVSLTQYETTSAESHVIQKVSQSEAEQNEKGALTHHQVFCHARPKQMLALAGQ